MPKVKIVNYNDPKYYFDTEPMDLSPEEEAELKEDYFAMGWGLSLIVDPKAKKEYEALLKTKGAEGEALLNS